MTTRQRAIYFAIAVLIAVAAAVSFEATIPGIFELELEQSQVLLAILEVRP